MITESLSTLKIHKLSQAQYDRELAAGRIDKNAIYLTPDDGSSVSAPFLKVTTVDLLADNWTSNGNLYSQVVEVNGVISNSKIDPQPTASQVIDLRNNNISLMAENDDGVVTFYAIGNKPDVDYHMQVSITEVVVV